MKKLMIAGHRMIEKQVPLSSGATVDVHYESNVGTPAVLNLFVVQSVATTDNPDVMLVVLTKRSETLLLKWNTADGEVEMNYVTGSVTRRSFLRMTVRKGLGPVIAVSRLLTYLDKVKENVQTSVEPGFEFTTCNAKLCVEYICADGSIVMRSTRIGSDKNKVYPTKTILVGPQNHDFWRATNLSLKWEDA